MCVERPGGQVRGLPTEDFGALGVALRITTPRLLLRSSAVHGGVIRGRLAMLSHIMLYRSHQARIYGFWRGGLLWLIDLMNARLRPSIRLD